MTLSSTHISSTGSGNHGFYVQLWFLLVSIIVFGAYVAWDLKLIALVISQDRSYMASLTIGLVVVMSLHCGWYIYQTTRHSRYASSWLNGERKVQGAGPAFMQQFVQDLSLQHPHEVEQSDPIMQIYSDSARAPAELGWFFVDLAIRLGLLGTIIGFILIFASLDNISIDGGDDLKNLLIAMSGGMGTALYTTLTGLVGASLLSFQYLILGRQSEYLIAQLMRMRSTISVDRSSYSRGL